MLIFVLTSPTLATTSTKEYLWKNLPLLIFFICKTCCPLLMALLACLVRSTHSQPSVNMDEGQVMMTEAPQSIPWMEMIFILLLTSLLLPTAVSPATQESGSQTVSFSTCWPEGAGRGMVRFLPSSEICEDWSELCRTITSSHNQWCSVKSPHEHSYAG